MDEELLKDLKKMIKALKIAGYLFILSGLMLLFTLIVGIVRFTSN